MNESILNNIQQNHEIIKRDIPLPDITTENNSATREDIDSTNIEFTNIKETLDTVQKELAEKKVEQTRVLAEEAALEDEIKLLSEFESVAIKYLKNKFDWESERNEENKETGEVKGLIMKIIRFHANNYTRMYDNQSFKAIFFNKSFNGLTFDTMKSELNKPDFVSNFLQGTEDPLVAINQASIESEIRTIKSPRDKILAFIKENPENMLRDQVSLKKFLFSMENTIDNNSNNQARVLSIYSEVNRQLKPDGAALIANDLLAIGVATNYFHLINRKKNKPESFNEDDEMLLTYFSKLFADFKKDFDLDQRYK